MNVENACASGGSAFLMAVEAVASGCVDVALAVGAEQMHHADKSRAFNALRGSTDVDDIGEVCPRRDQRQFAIDGFLCRGRARNTSPIPMPSRAISPRVAVKNRNHASAQSAGPDAQAADDRGCPGRADDRPAADAGDVLADDRRCGSRAGMFGEGAAEISAGPRRPVRACQMASGARGQASRRCLREGL